jgi:hypothetical protein
MDNGQMPSFDPFRIIVISVAGWMNQGQLQMIKYCGKNRLTTSAGSPRPLSMMTSQNCQLKL